MSNRTAIVASVLLTGCVSISVIMPGAAFAAPDTGSECLSAPKATTPAGGHWYYRLEKGTKRKCWYLGDAGGKVNKTAEAAPPSVAEQDSPPSKKPLQKSVANARAELRAGTSADEDTSLSESTWPPLSTAADEASHNDNQSAALQPAPEQAAPQNGNLLSRWPEPKSVASAAEQPATGMSAPAQTTPALTPDRLVMAAATPAPAATSAPVVQPAAATAPAEDNFSIRILLSILVGVLALAAIVGPMIFQSIKPQRNKRDTVQRRPIWDMNTSGAILRQDDPRMSPSLAYVDPLPEPRVLDEAVDEIEHLLSRASRRSAA